MRRISRIAPAAALAGALVLPLALGIDLNRAPTAIAQEMQAPAKPVFSLLGGRFTAPQKIALSAAPGAEIRYTLDGSAPTLDSPVYVGPITVANSANVAASAVVNGMVGPAAIEGYLIKTTEKPLASFVVMSDVHTSTFDDNQERWQKHFDTLQRILPSPDAIISNGDQINDNNFNTGDAHAVVRQIFEENLERKGMDGTKVLMSYGNHDDRLAKMSAMYPREWFPHDGNGYYQQEINGFPLLVLNTESYNAAQRAWVKERLTAITSDPAMRNKPVFVAGHRPIAGTVMDGMQASNQAINTDLSAFPQVVFFSGHSHYNINDERSMFQKNFTAVNDGSMTYGENPNQYWPNGEALAYTGHNTSSQSLVVEVYADRTEIDRINYAAEDERAYTPEGKWWFQFNPPYEAAGTLAGPSWTVRSTGATPEEIKAGFTYTEANRNATAPVAAAKQPTVRQGATGPVLRIPQASDDQFVHGYKVTITDVETGQVWGGINPNNEVGSDFYMAPRPAFVDIPLATRQGGTPGAGINNRIPMDREFTATIAPRDSYGNAGTATTITFVTGKLHLDTELAASLATQEAQVKRLLGPTDDAEASDFALALTDTAQATALLDALAAERAQLAAETTQDGIEARERTLRVQLTELTALMVAVDRSALATAIDEAAGLLAADVPLVPELARVAVPADRAALESALAAAREVAGTLNVQQADIDAAAGTLTAAIEAFKDAGVEPSPTPSATASPSASASATASPPQSASATPTASPSASQSAKPTATNVLPAGTPGGATPGQATSAVSPGEGQLANTGAGTALPFLGGLLLLGAGLGTWVVVRRRPAH